MAKVNLNFTVNSFNEGNEYWNVSLRFGSGGSESSAGGVVFKKTDGTDFQGGKKYKTLLLPINFISGGALKENQGNPKREQIEFEIEEYLLESKESSSTLKVKPAQEQEREISFILLKVREDEQKKALLLEIEKQGEEKFSKYPQKKVNYLILEKEVVELWERKGGVPLLSQQTMEGGREKAPGIFSVLNWGKKFTFTEFEWNKKVSAQLVGGGFNEKERVKFYEGFKAIEKEATGGKVFWNEWVIEKFAGDELFKEKRPIGRNEPILKIILEDTFRDINIGEEENEWTAELKALEDIKNEINNKRLTASNNLAEINEYIEKLAAYEKRGNKIKNWAWDIWDYNIHHIAEISQTLTLLERVKEKLTKKNDNLSISKTITENEKEKSGSSTITPLTDEIIDYESTPLDDFITAINKWRGIGRLGFFSEPDLQQVKDLIIDRLKEKCENYGLFLSEKGEKKIQYEEDLKELQDFIISNVNWDISSISEETYLFIGKKISISKIFADSTKIGFFGVNRVEQTHEDFYEALAEIIRQLIKDDDNQSEFLFAPLFIRESEENNFEYGLLVADRQEKIFHYYYFGYSARNSEAIKQVIEYLKGEAGDDYSLIIQDYELRQEEIPNIESNEEAIRMLTTFYWLAAKLEKKVETTSEGFWCQDKNNLLSAALTEVKKIVKQVIEVSENKLDLYLLAKKNWEKDEKTEELATKDIGGVIKFHKENEEWGEFSNFYSPKIAESTGKTLMNPIVSFLPHEINEQGEPGENCLFSDLKEKGKRLEWITGEHLFQALKLTISEKEIKGISFDIFSDKRSVVQKIREETSADKARKIGKSKIPIRGDWNEFRKLAMFYTIKEKFSFENNPDLNNFLMDTGYKIIIEDTRRKATGYSDSYWGNDDPDCLNSDNISKKNWYENEPNVVYGENRLGRTLMEWRSVFRLTTGIYSENNINSKEKWEKLKTALDNYYKKEYPHETYKQSFIGYTRSEIFALTKSYWTEDKEEIKAICNSIRELEIKVIDKSKEISKKMDEEPGEKIVEVERVEEVPATKKSSKEKKRISFSNKQEVIVFRDEEEPAKFHKYQIKEFSEKLLTKRERNEKEFQEYINYYRNEGDKKFTEDLNGSTITRPILDVFEGLNGDKRWKKVKKEVEEWKKEIDILRDSEPAEKEDKHDDIDEEIPSRDDYKHRVPTLPKPITENLTLPLPHPTEPAKNRTLLGLFVVVIVVGMLILLIFRLGRKRKEENIDE